MDCLKQANALDDNCGGVDLSTKGDGDKKDMSDRKILSIK